MFDLGILEKNGRKFAVAAHGFGWSKTQMGAFPDASRAL
jgi:hypothetical protein